MSKLNEKVLIKIIPFTLHLVFSIYYMAAPLLLIELKANPVELGLVGTLTSSVQMAMAHLMGHLSDRLGRRRLLLIAPLLFLTSCILVTLATKVWVILALSALNGLCLSMFWPSFQAWVADRQTGSRLARDIGSFNLSWTAATLVGPVLSGFLYSSCPQLPFLLGAALAFTVFFFILTSLQDRKTELAKDVEVMDSETNHWQRNFLVASWVANFASWFIVGNVRFQFPKLARELNTTPQMIGVLQSCVGLALLFGFFVLRKTDRWHFKKFHLLGVHLLGTAGILLIFLSSDPMLFALAFILIGLSTSMTYYSSLYYALHLITKKGRGTGIHESIVASATLSGPFLGGIAAHHTNLRTPYLLCLAVMFMALIAELILIKKRNTHSL